MSDSQFKPNNRYGAKITVTDVQKMRADYATGKTTQGALSRIYGISVIQIGRIIRYESWQNVPPFVLSGEDLALSANRILRIQEEAERRSAAQKMQDEIMEAREKGKTGDKYLDELTGGNNDGTPSSDT